jgi:multicomponent K+:H+ antiporter subunit G
MELPFWADLIVSTLIVLGTAFALIGSWGLARLSTFLKRVHGPTKTVTLGIGCVLIASALAFARQGELSGHELLITLFLFLTTPVSAHLLIQAALKLDPASRVPPPRD